MYYNNCSLQGGKIMPVQYSEIQELLRSRADLHARLNLMPYDGTPEIKERGDKKRLFLRKSLFLINFTVIILVLELCCISLNKFTWNLHFLSN